jgi:hypothetical protein
MAKLIVMDYRPDVARVVVRMEYPWGQGTRIESVYLNWEEAVRVAGSLIEAASKVRNREMEAHGRKDQRPNPQPHSQGPE